MKKAIVFGANGYLGRHIANFLKTNNIEFIPVGNSVNSIDGFENYEQVDITQSQQIVKIDFDVDFIFVFAGLTGTNIGFEQYHKFIDVNENGLLNILKYHTDSKSKARIVFPSTRLVYKGVKDTPLTEISEKEALTVYAQNKIACEGYLKMYQNYFNIDYTIFRICVPYGNLMDDTYSYGTLGFFLNKAKNQENISLYGDGTQKRTFTHVNDIIEAIFKTLTSKKSINNVYNIGSNDDLSLLEVANLVANKNGVGVDFVEWPENALKVESGDTIFDDNKLKQEIGYTYKKSLESWIANT
jgi:UDP-glucose 4-epimerase